MIDTHCHLDAAEFVADREAVVDAAHAAGVRMLIVPAVSAASFPAVQALCARHASCRPAYGLHPLYTPQVQSGDLDTLRHTLQQVPDCCAVGEIGLDFYVPGLDTARQLEIFRAQLRLARDFDLPVLLHVRRAVDAVLAEIRRFKPRGGIAHAFNGSPQQAEQFLSLGFKLGFGGAMTYSGSTRIRRLATELPLEGLVLETDAPDIPPAWCAGGRNTPAELPRIAAVLAELRQIPLAELVVATSANARQVLRLGS